MKCEYCDNEFTTKASLNNHMKTAKYCLASRNIKSEEEHKCEACQQIFTRMYHLNRHRRTCKMNDVMYDLMNKVDELTQERDTHKSRIEDLCEIISDQKTHILALEDKLENIAIQAVKRSTNTTNKTQINNYIQNLQPVTDETFIENIPNLTIEHILKGPEGYAEYALEFPLKDRIVCVDYARRKVKFKDMDGIVITDPEMTNIATKFFQSIKDKNKELILDYGNQLQERFGDEMDTIVEILEYKAGVDRGSDGEKTDFQYNFVKQMCSKTISE